MLTALAIRDVVLIEALDLEFGAGLGVLTGETGAGKSILLDALGLALGARGEASLVRQGASQAVVTASFDEPHVNGPIAALLAENGLDVEPGEPKPGRVFDEDGARICAIRIGGQTNLELRFDRPLAIRLPGLPPKGGEHRVDALRFWADDPDAVLSAVRARLTAA